MAGKCVPEVYRRDMTHRHPPSNLKTYKYRALFPIHFGTLQGPGTTFFFPVFHHPLLSAAQFFFFLYYFTSILFYFIFFFLVVTFSGKHCSFRVHQHRNCRREVRFRRELFHFDALCSSIDRQKEQETIEGRTIELDKTRPGFLE